MWIVLKLALKAVPTLKPLLVFSEQSACQCVATLT